MRVSRTVSSSSKGARCGTTPRGSRAGAAGGVRDERAVFDTTGNVFFKLKYARLYDSVLATPLGPRDVAVGEVTWALIRGAGYAVAFLVVMVPAHVVTSWWAVLPLPAAVLIGQAFAGVGMAATTYMRSWQDLDLVQLAVLPMFLFSATFYPLSTYPPALRWVVEITPLYH